MKFFHTVTLRMLTAAMVLLCGFGVARADWSELPSLPVTQLWGATSHYIDGTIYVVGGARGPNNAPNPSNAVYALDVEGNATEWESVATLPSDIYLHSSAVLNGKIYVFGGIAAGQPNTSTFIFDPSDKSVTSGPSMPRSSYQAKAVAVGSRAYIISGLTYNGQAQLTQSIMMFDANTGQFTDGNQTNGLLAPYATFDCQTTVIGSDIYLMGGYSANFSQYIVLFKGAVNGDAITWTRLPDFPDGLGISAGGATLLDGKPFIAGGNPSSTGYNRSFFYSPADNAWTPYNNLPAQTIYPAMSTDGMNAYMAGGQGTNKVYIADNNFTPEAVVEPSVVRTAVEKGSNGKVSLIISNQGAAELNVSFSSDDAWINAPSEMSFGGGARQRVAVQLSSSDLEVGRHSGTIMLTTNDESNAEIEVAVDLWVMDELPLQPNKVVLEESNGTWCPPCGEYGIPAVEAFMDEFGDQGIVISYHDDGGGGQRHDPFAFTQGETLNSRLGLNAFPTGSVQRIRWNNASSQQLSAGTPWLAAGAEVLAESENAPAAFTVKNYTYNPGTRQVTANVEITTSAPIRWTPGSSLRVTAVVVEEGLRYTQAFVSKQAEEITHAHVARHIWPNPDGQLVTLAGDATADDGTILKPGVTMSVPVSFTVPEMTIPTTILTGTPSSVDITPENCEIVFLVHMNESTFPDRILNAQKMELVQGVVGDAVTINFPGTKSKSIKMTETAEFKTSVSNNTDEPVEVTITRTSNDLPSNWYSEICTGASDCSDVSTVSFTIGAGATHEFALKVYGGSDAASGSVTLQFQSGNVTESETFSVQTVPSTGVAYPGEVGGLSMNTITPNPASSSAQINVSVPTGSETTLEVFSVTGQKVATLFEGRLEAGERQIDADVSALQSGKYVLVLTAGDKKVSRTLTVVR